MNNTKVWVVQKWIKDLEFEFCGVFSTEEKALASCIHKDCYVAPVILDDKVSEERIPWLGLYYPYYEKLNKV